MKYRLNKIIAKFIVLFVICGTLWLALMFSIANKEFLVKIEEGRGKPQECICINNPKEK